MPPYENGLASAADALRIHDTRGSKGQFINDVLTVLGSILHFLVCIWPTHMQY